MEKQMDTRLSILVFIPLKLVHSSMETMKYHMLNLAGFNSVTTSSQHGTI